MITIPFDPLRILKGKTRIELVFQLWVAPTSTRLRVLKVYFVDLQCMLHPNCTPFDPLRVLKLPRKMQIIQQGDEATA